MADNTDSGDGGGGGGGGAEGGDVVVLPPTPHLGGGGSGRAGRSGSRHAASNSRRGGASPSAAPSSASSAAASAGQSSGPNAMLEKAMVAKVVLLGESGVGKSSLVFRYVEGQFSPVTKSTIGASFFTKRLLYDGCKAKLQIWDTAGQERFRSLAPMFYRGAAAAVVIYDITNTPSFERMKSWVKELQNNVKEDIVLIIVGNKADQAASRSVSAATAEEFVRACGAASYFETSAKNNTNVDDCFAFIAKTLIIRYKDAIEAGGRPFDADFDPNAGMDGADGSFHVADDGSGGGGGEGYYNQSGVGYGANNTSSNNFGGDSSSKSSSCCN